MFKIGDKVEIIKLDGYYEYRETGLYVGNTGEVTGHIRENGAYLVHLDNVQDDRDTLWPFFVRELSLKD